MTASVLQIDWNHIELHGTPDVLSRYRLAGDQEVVLATIQTLGGAFVVWVRDRRGPSINGLGILPGGEDSCERDGKPVVFKKDAPIRARAEFLIRCLKEDSPAAAGFDELSGA